MNLLILGGALVVVVISCILTYFITKNKATSQIAVLSTRLNTEQELHRAANQQLLQANISINELNDKLNQRRDEATRLAAEQKELQRRLAEQQAFMDRSAETMKASFHALSAEVLKHNNESFVTLAKTTLATQVTEAKGDLEKKQQAIDALVKPLADSLGKFDHKIQEMEKARMEQHGQINQYMQGVAQMTEQLQKETHNLVTALKTSHTRGRYGEIALRRLVEFAGMTEHCDFEEQVSVASTGGMLRPDMIIRLPEKKIIVVDSKVPLSSYMRAFETENEEERKQLLAQHAQAVRDHLRNLSDKAYWNQFSESPDYVVLYMQIESSFGAALAADPTLIEEGIRRKVVFATPTTLITLLRTVGFVWQQVRITENIEEMRGAGVELYNRTATLLGHFSNIGNSLNAAVKNYNQAVSSMESRFIPQAKKLQALSGSFTSKEVPDVEPVELNARAVAEMMIENNNNPIT